MRNRNPNETEKGGERDDTKEAKRECWNRFTKTSVLVVEVVSYLRRLSFEAGLCNTCDKITNKRSETTVNTFSSSFLIFTYVVSESYRVYYGDFFRHVSTTNFYKEFNMTTIPPLQTV